MKILIISDNHFRENNLNRAVMRHSEIDYYVHCGDSQWPTHHFLLRKFICVRGNNDLRTFPQEELLTIEKTKILITHGHDQFVVYYGKENHGGTLELVEYTKSIGANLVFFGHTHVPIFYEQDGVLVVNPGSIDFPRSSLRIPTYAILTIEGKNYSIQFFHGETGEDITNRVLKEQ